MINSQFNVTLKHQKIKVWSNKCMNKIIRNETQNHVSKLKSSLVEL